MNVDENSKSIHRTLEGLKELYPGRLEKLRLCAWCSQSHLAEGLDAKS
jgi:hypothetical protein